MIILFEKIIGEKVTLTLTFPEPMIITSVLIAISFIVYAISANTEKNIDMDPFKKTVRGSQIDRTAGNND